METANNETQTTFAANLKRGDRYFSRMRGGEFKTVSSWNKDSKSGKIRIGHTDGDVEYFDDHDPVQVQLNPAQCLVHGQFGEIQYFLNDKLTGVKMIKFLKEDSDGNLVFTFDEDENYRLTVSKKCYPIHEYISGDGDIVRKTVIEMFPPKTATKP